MKKPIDAQGTVAWDPYGPCLIGGKPRDRLPDFVYVGDDHSHWNGQRCEVVGTETDANNRCDVVFACGCASNVPRTCVRRISRS
jgi:hypothetical protein